MPSAMAPDRMAEDGTLEEAMVISAGTLVVTRVGMGTAEMSSITVMEDMAAIPATSDTGGMPVIPAIMAIGGTTATTTTTTTTMACGSRLARASWD